MKIISIFDTSIANYNTGNHIIMEAVYENLHKIFLCDFLYKIPYIDLTNHAISCLSHSDIAVWGGTNSLCGEMEKYTQWGINAENVKFVTNKVVLMGLGWWQYQNNTSSYTKKLLHKAINSDYLSSVRDNYTVNKLKSLGFDNIINTGCPTLWGLTKEHCCAIPDRISSDAVVITITDYNKNIERDRKMIETAIKHYKNIFLWPQGIGDASYLLKGLKLSEIQILPPNLASFDDFLTKEQPDYIGTRLHGGIRALQKKCRAIIIAVDNRAIEMGRDFNLPVIDINQLDKVINLSFKNIELPFEDISKWKKQFLNFDSSASSTEHSDTFMKKSSKSWINDFFKYFF